MSYAATRSSGGNHRSHSNSNLHHNSNANHHHHHNHHHHNSNNNNSTNSSSSNPNTNQTIHYHQHPHHPYHQHHTHPHHHSHQHPNPQHNLNQHHHNHHLQPLVAAGDSSSSSVSSTSSSSASQHQAAVVAAAAVAAQPQQVAVDLSPENDNNNITTLTAGHASTTPTTAPVATCSTGPPHYVDLHVNAGECVSLQLFDGQEQLVAGPATITLVSQQQNPPVPIPVQVPPGHMIHQIADENGTLKHIILSVMDPSGAPPADPAGPPLDSNVIALPQGGGVGGTFWNSNHQAAGAIYQPPSYNNIVATGAGTGQNNYQQQSPSGITNHIHSNGKQQQQQPSMVVPTSGYPQTAPHTNHGPHIRTGGAGSGSISPMRSRLKGQHHNHNQHHHQQHHHHHNNHSHSHNHHHQQLHHGHRSASSSSSTTANSSSHNNSHHSNHTHYHPSPINNNNNGNIVDHHTNSYNNAASFAEAASPTAISRHQSQTPPPPATLSSSSQAPTILNQKILVAASQDKSGPAWQPGNKFINHNQQQVQSKCLSPASGQSSVKATTKQVASPTPPATTISSPALETSNNFKFSNKTSNNNKQQDSSTNLSPSSVKSIGGGSKERQQPNVNSTVQQQQSPTKATAESDTTRVSRGKQKKHQAPSENVVELTNKEDYCDADKNEVKDGDGVGELSINEESATAQRLPKPSKSKQESSVGRKEKTDFVDEVLQLKTAVADSPTRSTATTRAKANIKNSMRTSLSENNIQGLEAATSSVAAGNAKSEPAASVVESTVQATSNSEPLVNEADEDDDDDVPAPLSKKKSTSVESSKRRRSSKGAEPKSLKLTALPQLKILNLSCTSVTSSSVQLRWSYVPTVAEKYGIQQQHHHHHSKHMHILDHFVIETSAEKNADTNQLIAPRVVYQGCAMTCRVAHLQADKIHHFRVRRTALVNAAATAAATESGCTSSKQEHLVVSEILSVTLASIQQPVQQQQQQQSKKKGPTAAMVISTASTGDANRGNASSHQHSSNSNHHNHHNHNGGGVNIKSSSTGTIKLSNLSKQCRTKIVSMFGRMVKNSLSSCSDTKFAGLLLVLFTIFAMLLAIFIHLYFVAPVID